MHAFAAPGVAHVRHSFSSIGSRFHRQVRSHAAQYSAHNRWHASASPGRASSVGFIGLGVMGLPMAANLANKNVADLVVWNRSPERFDALRKALDSGSSNVTMASSAKSVIESCNVTFSMLSTPEAVASVFHEGAEPALDAIAPGKSLVDCSTLCVEDMKRTNTVVTEKGGIFLEAPVSGSKVPAEKGQLIFLCAGDENLFTSATDALDAMGKRSFFLGEVGNGTKMKLIVNQLMGTMLAALAESITLAESLNISVSDLLDVLDLGAMANPMFALKGPKMKHDVKEYNTNFPLEHAQKDMRFAQLLGDQVGIGMGVSSAANEWFKSAKGMGLDRKDFAAVIESVRAAAGR